jgi:RsiW-degrading membrane proteinase PrsW (M82 family)
MLLISILVALLPGFAWMFFYLKEDANPEPKMTIAKVFVAGGACAFVALAVQVALQHIGISFSSESVASPSDLTLRVGVAIILFALVEEIVKFAAVYASMHNDPEFQEPIDAMIYMVVAALGFATIENIGAIHGHFSTYSGYLLAGAIFETITFRFVGATLLHTLSSALLGYYWALHMRDLHEGNKLLWGIVLATVLHAAFNYLIISYGNLFYAVAFLAVIGFFVLNDFEKLKVRPV